MGTIGLAMAIFFLAPLFQRKGLEEEEEQLAGWLARREIYLTQAVYVHIGLKSLAASITAYVLCRGSMYTSIRVAYVDEMQASRI